MPIRGQTTQSGRIRSGRLRNSYTKGSAHERLGRREVTLASEGRGIGRGLVTAFGAAVTLGEWVAGRWRWGCLPATKARVRIGDFVGSRSRRTCTRDERRRSMAVYLQADRPMTMTTPLGADDLLLAGFEG